MPIYVAGLLFFIYYELASSTKLLYILYTGQHWLYIQYYKSYIGPTLISLYWSASYYLPAYLHRQHWFYIQSYKGYGPAGVKLHGLLYGWPTLITQTLFTS